MHADRAALEVHGEGSKAAINECQFQWNCCISIGCFDGGSAEISRSKLSRNHGPCMLASGNRARLTCTNTEICDCTGAALKARHMAEINASDVRVMRCSSGAEGKSGATVTCTQCRFQGCSLRACGVFGGAKMTLTGITVSSSANRSLHAVGDGSFLTCVESGLLRSSGTQALCEHGAELLLEKVQVVEGIGDGIAVTGQASSAVISECLVSKQQGAALRAMSGQVTVTGSSITGCGSIASIEQCGCLDIKDSRIEDCHRGLSGGGLAQINTASTTFANIRDSVAICVLDKGAAVRMQACCIRSCSQGGILLGPGTKCELADCTFEDNRAPCVHTRGPNAEAAIHQCQFDGNIGPCISGQDHGSVMATDCCIRNTAGHAVCIDGIGSAGKLRQCNFTGTSSHALVAQAGGLCDVDTCVIERSQAGAGLVALGEGSTITCVGGHVTNMQQAAVVSKDRGAVNCKDMQLRGTFSGSGCIASGGGSFTARNCSLEGNTDHGVLVAEGGQAQLHACRCSSLALTESLPCLVCGFK